MSMEGQFAFEFQLCELNYDFYMRYSAPSQGPDNLPLLGVGGRC
jgi:hypothetical protein